VALTHSLKVLVVDDEPDQIRMTKMFLNDIDPELSIETALTASDAIKKVKQTNYDCVILDHVMPDITGLDLALQIKRISDSPIILYTSKGSEDIASQSPDFGVDNYLRKDSNLEHFETLARRIRNLADSHFLEQLGKAEYEYEMTNPPDYPKVEVVGRLVYIVNEDGSKDIWADESSIARARVTGKEISDVLKAIKDKREYISKLIHDLKDMEVPTEYRNDLIKRSYDDLRVLLNKLNQMRTYKNSDSKIHQADN
jgi:CheY-like chemotaxis protein